MQVNGAFGGVGFEVGGDGAQTEAAAKGTYHHCYVSRRCLVQIKVGCLGRGEEDLRSSSLSHRVNGDVVGGSNDVWVGRFEVRKNRRKKRCSVWMRTGVACTSYIPTKEEMLLREGGGKKGGGDDKTGGGGAWSLIIIKVGPPTNYLSTYALQYPRYLSTYLLWTCHLHVKFFGVYKTSVVNTYLSSVKVLDHIKSDWRCWLYLQVGCLK